MVNHTLGNVGLSFSFKGANSTACLPFHHPKCIYFWEFLQLSVFISEMRFLCTDRTGLTHRMHLVLKYLLQYPPHLSPNLCAEWEVTVSPKSRGITWGLRVGETRGVHISGGKTSNNGA